MQLQTQLTPNQIELLFAEYIEYQIRQDRHLESTKAVMNLREISAFNVEVVKERYVNLQD